MDTRSRSGAARSNGGRGCAMAQETTGLKAALSLPAMYDLLQRALGARAFRREIAERYVRAEPGDRVIDVGCGTGEMVAALPRGIAYRGFDLSEAYIASARRRFGDRGTFECMDVASASRLGGLEADVVLAIGLLHHLDDAECASLLGTLHALLEPGGRVVTVDPTLCRLQHPVAAFLARRDRGRNVRSPEGYAALARPYFASVAPVVRHDLLRVPYSHCVLELAR